MSERSLLEIATELDRIYDTPLTNELVKAVEEVGNSVMEVIRELRTKPEPEESNDV